MSADLISLARVRAARGMPSAPAAPRMPHPALGPCVECGSERIFALQAAGDPGPVGVRCEGCGLVLSLSELSRLYRFADGTPGPVGGGGHV